MRGFENNVGENEQGGMLRTVVVLGIIAIITFVMIVATVALTNENTSIRNDTVSHMDDAMQDKIDADKTNYHYQYNTDNLTASIYGIKDVALAKGNDVTVPGNIIHDNQTFKVIGIGSSVFADVGITGVSLPDSITTIGSYAFKDNNLTSISLPSSLTSIADGAFMNNKLSAISLPKGVTSVGNYAFQQNKLSMLTLNDGLLTIGDGGFNQNSLTKVVIPDTVKSVGKFAFSQNNFSKGSVTMSKTTTYDNSYDVGSFGLVWDSGTKSNIVLEPTLN